VRPPQHRPRAAVAAAVVAASALILSACGSGDSADDSGEAGVPDAAELTLDDLRTGDDEDQIRKTVAASAHAAAEGDGATLAAVMCPPLFDALGIDAGPFDPPPGTRRLTALEDVLVREDSAQVTVTWAQTVPGEDGTETEEAVGPDVLLLVRDDGDEGWVLCETEEMLPGPSAGGDEDAGAEPADEGPGGEPAP